MHLATSSRQQWLVAEEEEEPFPTMVTNGDVGEVSKNNTKMAEVRKKKETVLGRREENNSRILEFQFFLFMCTIYVE